MSAAAADLAPVRRAQRVARLQVRVPAEGPEAWRNSARWRQRVEDALRCTPLAGGHRLLLLRRLRVRTSVLAAQAGSAAWQAQVDEACREAAAQARHGLDPAAAQAEAVWFADWDEAIGACLDVVLARRPGQALAQWHWLRVLRLAELPATLAASAGPDGELANGTPALAKALWRRWQADAAGSRALRAWLAARPQVARWLAPDEAASPAVFRTAEDLLTQAAAGQTLATPPAADIANQQVTRPATPPESPPSPTPPNSAAALSTASSQPRPTPPAAAPESQQATAQQVDRPALPHNPTTAPARAVIALDEAPALQATRLAGLPLVINALSRLGVATAWQAVAEACPDAATRALAGSSPWLWACSQLGPAARRQALADPMRQALPAAEWWPQAEALWAAWQAAPPAVHALGRRAWAGLVVQARHRRAPSPRALLQRPGGLALTATHLDVVFRLDDAELTVRRLGLDQDPGWVSWFGRIVQIHFQPTLPWGDLP